MAFEIQILTQLENGGGGTFLWGKFITLYLLNLRGSKFQAIIKNLLEGFCIPNIFLYIFLLGLQGSLHEEQ